jgi:hypothetical protein
VIIRPLIRVWNERVNVFIGVGVTNKEVKSLTHLGGKQREEKTL